LTAVYKDLERYETLATRREPYTPAMQLVAFQYGAKADAHSPNGLISTLVDGFGFGLQAGLRLTEWAQPAGNTNVSTPHLNIMRPPHVRTRALCPVDIRVATISKRRFVGICIALIAYDTITHLWVKFRTQKNGANGEERLFTPNPSSTAFCPVRCIHRLLCRLARIQLLDPRVNPHTPLSVYLDHATGLAKLITANEIELFMRGLAIEAHGLHPAKDADALQLFSAHSIRVGACVLLHVMGFTFVDIKWILRWKSDAFMAYLRNMAILSHMHNRAVDRAATMPHVY